MAEVSKICVDMKEKREASVRENRSLVLYTELKNNWERETGIEVCTYEQRKGMGWWSTVWVSGG
jgi:hypothetical protein